jgi:hypothetical protein
MLFNLSQISYIRPCPHRSGGNLQGNHLSFWPAHSGPAGWCRLRALAKPLVNASCLLWFLLRCSMRNETSGHEFAGGYDVYIYICIYTYISSSLTCPIRFEALFLLWKHVKICEMNWRTFPLLLTPPKAKDPHFDTPSQHVEDFDEVLGRQGGQGAANSDVGVFNGFHLPFFYHFSL